MRGPFRLGSDDDSIDPAREFYMVDRPSMRKVELHPTGINNQNPFTTVLPKHVTTRKVQIHATRFHNQNSSRNLLTKTWPVTKIRPAGVCGIPSEGANHRWSCWR